MAELERLASQLDSDISDAAAHLSDADNAMEALRLVGNTICELQRGRDMYGHGGAQAAQIEALMYLVRQVQGHVRQARDANDRCEAAIDGRPAPLAAE